MTRNIFEINENIIENIYNFFHFFSFISRVMVTGRRGGRGHFTGINQLASNPGHAKNLQNFKLWGNMAVLVAIYSSVQGK